MSRKKCFASVTRRGTGDCEWTETDFFYEDDQLGQKLRDCSTLDEAKAVLGDQGPNVKVLEVVTYQGKLK